MNFNLKREDILNIQYKEICELRNEMAQHLSSKNGDMEFLIVGEGVEWNVTFLGYCIINGILPKNVRNITLIDLNFTSEKLSFKDNLCFQGYESLRITAIEADARDMPFEKNTFDVIVAPLMIDDCPNHLKLLSEFQRCVKKKGKVILAGHGNDSHTEYSNIPDLLGSNHVNQTNLNKIKLLLKKFNTDIVKIWENKHTWLIVYLTSKSEVRKHKT
ncbi:MAG: class I SAM-dependent methyltransferase [Brumimicrobium sp.]|nr:class I SAM-dependent methyltransferase [Brumimicrobium sp.]